MICTPCQEPHHVHECIDNTADPPRTGLARHCYCQHAPRRDGRVPARGPRSREATGEESPAPVDGSQTLPVHGNVGRGK